MKILLLSTKYLCPCRKGLRGVVDIISSFFTNASPQRLAIFAAVVVVVIGILLTVSLLPASFVYVEYHEVLLL